MLINLDYVKFLRSKKLSGNEILVYIWFILYFENKPVEINEFPSLSQIGIILDMKPGVVSHVVYALRKKKVLNIIKKINGNNIKTTYSLVKQL
jgi:hypothetical protein